MQLDSVRELKRDLVEQRPGGALVLADALGVSVAAQRARDLARPQPTIALGVARRGEEFQLAVRVQHRDLMDSEPLAAIDRAARGETDVQYVGRVTKRGGPPLRGRERPVRIGASVGHHAITAGTVGAFVAVARDARPRLLSNNHVLADENRAALGDAILQPGKFDGGTDPDDRVATLERFVALRSGSVNEVDCALAVIDEGVEVDARCVPTLGTLAGLLEAEEAERVAKVGRTTGVTHGAVSAFEVDNVIVEFDTGLMRFDGQVEISSVERAPFSRGGDSGSLIVSADGDAAIGLLFAGSDQGGPDGFGVTFANPIATVLERLEAEGLWARGDD